MVTEAFIRRVALALPGAYEQQSHDGQPSWRTKPRMFCWIRTKPDALVVWVESLGAKEAMLATQPKMFFTTPHYDGYPMLLVRMSAVSQKQARAVVEASWKLRAPASLVKRYVASLLVVFACFLGTACDDSCGPKALADLCGTKCPKNRAEAIVAVCAADGGWLQGEAWVERKNSCGGTSVETMEGGIGVSYSFDRDGKLVGGVSWEDTDIGQCNSFDTYYGKHCEGMDYTEHECAGGS